MIAKMINLSPPTFLFFLLFLCIKCADGWNTSSRAGEPKVRCVEAEKQALLKIKKDLQLDWSGVDPLSSWGNEEEKRDCCKWLGIACAKRSGHVIRLDLSRPVVPYLSIRGQISSSLSELPYLKYLDLSLKFFRPTSIPSSIGNLSQLRYLNLSINHMFGYIPPQIANLSHLQVLDLSGNYDLTVKNLEWVSQLFSLRSLDLSCNDLSKAIDWAERLNKVPSLTNLQLIACNLPNISNSLSLTSIVNSSSSLAIIDLSANLLTSSIFQWLVRFNHSLLHLGLSYNHLEGFIPKSFGKMTTLTYLDLSFNQLNGTIPEGFGNVTALEYLDLGRNMLEGEIPKSIWNLSRLHTLRLGTNSLRGHLPETTFPKLKQLEELDLSGNSFKGELSQAHFSNLSELYYLDLSFNSLSLNIRDSDWIPPFRLAFILLGSCKLGPQFPKWLQNQKNYSVLDISNSEISDSIPNWFWDLSTRFRYMNLSHNQITGDIGKVSLELQQYKLGIDLSSNQLEGPVPSFLFKVPEANLSRNRFSKLNLLCNITGATALEYLDVSYNELLGELPDCWWHFKELEILILTHNKLSGKIPPSMGSLTKLQTLRFSNNNFIGELPSTLRNCTKLLVIDFGGNKLSGSVPTWMGESLPDLSILSLRSNFFTGHIPWNLCHLACLKILDLSLNDISGGIPTCLGNFTSMRSWGSNTCATISSMSWSIERGRGEYIYKRYEDKIQLQWKGKLMDFETILGLVKSIDLSSNMLTGEIPSEITELIGLVSLNLSRNNLTGQIPPKIGQLRSLDFLDLSRNHLVGKLPSSLAQIDRLNTFDVSNNNLSGKVPTSTQLQSFPVTAYMGNPLLCGDPLPNRCEKDQEQAAPQVSEEGDEDELLNRGFYISLAIGFAISFWGVSGTLIFSKSFRDTSRFKFKLLNDAADFIGVTTAIYKAKLLRIIKS